jgi:hypothetical protein
MSWSKYDKDEPQDFPNRSDNLEQTDDADWQPDRTGHLKELYTKDTEWKTTPAAWEEKQDLAAMYPKDEQGREQFPVSDPFMTSPAFLKRVAKEFEHYKPSTQELNAIATIRRNLIVFPLSGGILGYVFSKRLAIQRQFIGSKRTMTIGVLSFWGAWTGGILAMMLSRRVAERDLAQGGMANILRREIVKEHLAKYGSVPEAWSDALEK